MICKRFALVGSGFIGQVHAASLARHEGSALTMVADAAPERAQALAARYGARAVTVVMSVSCRSEYQNSNCVRNAFMPPVRGITPRLK